MYVTVTLSLLFDQLFLIYKPIRNKQEARRPCRPASGFPRNIKFMLNSHVMMLPIRSISFLRVQVYLH